MDTRFTPSQLRSLRAANNAMAQAAAARWTHSQRAAAADARMDAAAYGTKAYNDAWGARFRHRMRRDAAIARYEAADARSKAIIAAATA